MDDPQVKQHSDVVAPAPQPGTPPPSSAVNSQVEQLTPTQPSETAGPVQQAPATTQEQAPAAPVSPVGSVNKEAAPVPHVVDVMPSDHTELPPQVDQELKEVGVEATPQVEHPKLTLDDKRAGLTEAAAAVPVTTTTGTQVQLPMTEEKAQEVQKTESLKESRRWLAEEVLRELKKHMMKLLPKKGS